MNRPSIFARLLHAKAPRDNWLTASAVLTGAVACVIAARISIIRPNAQVLSSYFQRVDAGPLLRLYDRFAGYGISRGTVAALGFMPYLSARVFTWLARSLSPTLDARWSSEDGRVERKWWTGGLTFVLALVQSFGLARFTLALPGAVVQPAAPLVAETMIVQTAVAMFLMWVGEQIVDPTEVALVPADDACRSADPRFGRDENPSVLASGQRNAFTAMAAASSTRRYPRWWGIPAAPAHSPATTLRCSPPEAPAAPPGCPRGEDS